MSSTAPAVPLPVTACVLSSVPGLLVSSEPAQLHLITYQLAQASIWQGVPGLLGAPGQLVQLPPMGAPCPPAYGWGQHAGTGKLVPNQLMGLGLWAMGSPCTPRAPMCCTSLPAPAPPPPCRPTAQHWVQRSPVLHTLISSAKKLSEASNKDVVDIEDSIPTTSPGRTMTKPKGEFWGVAEPQLDHVSP